MINNGQFRKGQKPWNKGKEKNINIDIIKKKYLIDLESANSIAKDFNVSEKTIRNRLVKEGIKLRNKNNPTTITRKKISDTLKRKGIQPKERFSGEIWNKGLTKEDERVKKNIKNLLEARKYQVLPVKDTSIELKLQKFLDDLNITYEKHKYLFISHAYQCDLFIPSLNLVLEADGKYWHNYPTGREIDKIRTKELLEQGFKVIRLWEDDINNMSLEDFKELIKNVQAI